MKLGNYPSRLMQFRNKTNWIKDAVDEADIILLQDGNYSIVLLSFDPGYLNRCLRTTDRHGAHRLMLLASLIREAIILLTKLSLIRETGVVLGSV